MKWWKKIVIILAAVILAVVILKDLLIQCAICNVGSSLLGAPVSIGSFHWDCFNHKIHIRRLLVDDPPGFPRQTMVNIPAVDVNYNLSDVMNGHMHFHYIHVDLEEMVIVKNAQGRLNVDSLKIAQKSANASVAAPPQKQADRPLSIDIMKLSFERTVYMDYSGKQPIVRVYDVGFKDKKFKNIKSARQVAAIILVQGMAPAAIKSAAIYGVATVLGAGLLPVAAVAVLAGQDSAEGYFASDYDHVYSAAEDVLKNSGQLVSEQKSTGFIAGRIDGGDVTVQIQDMNGKIRVAASCRKLFLPRHEIAAGFIYQLSQRLK